MSPTEPHSDQGAREWPVIVRDVCGKHRQIDCAHCHFYRLVHGPIRFVVDQVQFDQIQPDTEDR